MIGIGYGGVAVWLLAGCGGVSWSGWGQGEKVLEGLVDAMLLRLHASRFALLVCAGPSVMLHMHHRGRVESVGLGARERGNWAQGGGGAVTCHCASLLNAMLGVQLHGACVFIV